MSPLAARRQLLRYFAASPLAASPAFAPGVAALLAAAPRVAPAQTYDALRAGTGDVTDVIATPAQALDVFDFEPAAKKALEASPTHFGYLASGVDDDGTLQANRDAFAKYSVRVRRLIDARKIDTSLTVFGQKWGSPIGLAPVSSLAAFHPDAEGAVARAAAKRKHHMILSTVATTSIEDVNKELRWPAWYMLYPTDDWTVTQALVKRAEAAGAPAIVLTVDRQGGRNTQTMFRYRRGDKRECTVCHQPGSFANEVVRKPMFSGLDLSRVTNLYGTGMTWEFVDRLRAIVKGRLLLKGIMTREDAAEALRHGVDGIIVSNHGGRAEASNQSTLGVLPEVVKAVNGRVPVFVDGGFRRGTDVFKALALGAKAVCIGRPYCWGLAAFGEQGVERVLELVQAEFETIMKQAGTTSLAQISMRHVDRA